MNNLQKIYIAREYMLIDDFGGVRIDEEAVFTSFDDAKNFVDTLVDMDAEDSDLLLFRIEIIEYAVRDINSHMQKWIYNLKGEIIDAEPKLSDNHSLKNSYSYSGKHRVGDLVYIVPKIQNKLSPSVKGTYGVIVEVPFSQDKATSTNKVEPREEYVVYYINEKGLLDHLHAVESALCVHKNGMPYEFQFLELYAKHLKKEKSLPDTLISQLLKEDIFLRRIKIFDFHNENISGNGQARS